MLPRPPSPARFPPGGNQHLSRPGQSRAKRDEEHAWCPGLAISTGSGHARRPGYTVLGRGLHQRPLCTELHVVRCRRLAIDLALLFDRREGCPECAIAAAAKLTRRTVLLCSGLVDGHSDLSQSYVASHHPPPTSTTATHLGGNLGLLYQRRHKKEACCGR